MKKTVLSQPPVDHGVSRIETYHRMYQQSLIYINRYESYVVIKNKLKACVLGVATLGILFILLSLGEGNHFQIGVATWLTLILELFLGVVWFNLKSRSIDLSPILYEQYVKEAEILRQQYGFK